MKGKLLKILSIVLCVVLGIGVIGGGVYLAVYSTNRPSVTIDVSEKDRRNHQRRVGLFVRLCRARTRDLVSRSQKA